MGNHILEHFENIWTEGKWSPPSSKKYFSNNAYTALGLLLIVIFWIIIAHLVGNKNIGEPTVYIFSCIALLSTALIVFSDFNSQGKVLLTLFIPPMILFKTKIYLRWETFSLFLGYVFTAFYIYLWVAKIKKENRDIFFSEKKELESKALENQDFLAERTSGKNFLLSIIFIFLVSLLSTLVSVLLQDLPKKFPFIPVVMFFDAKLSRITAVILLLIIFIVSFFLILFSSNKNISTKRKKFSRINIQKPNNVFEIFSNSLIKAINIIIIPFAEIISNLLITIIENLFFIFRQFVSLIRELSVKVWLLLKNFFHFFVIPTTIGGITAFFAHKLAHHLYSYIHSYKFIDLLFIFYLLAILLLFPFSLMAKFEYKTIVESYYKYLEEIMFPYVGIILILPIISFILIFFEIRPYRFGLLSQLSLIVWGIGIFITIKKIKEGSKKGDSEDNNSIEQSNINLEK